MAKVAKIDARLAKYPELSAVRIREEIARGPDGYTGSGSVVRRYLRTWHDVMIIYKQG